MEGAHRSPSERHTVSQDPLHYHRVSLFLARKNEYTGGEIEIYPGGCRRGWSILRLTGWRCFLIWARVFSPCSGGSSDLCIVMQNDKWPARGPPPSIIAAGKQIGHVGARAACPTGKYLLRVRA
jgi:hypothetical protein